MRMSKFCVRRSSLFSEWSRCLRRRRTPRRRPGQRPVKFLVPFGPGAGVDIGARLLADRLTARWGKPVVIENRPGADGLVAIQAFLAANDDHTLLASPSGSFTVHPFQYEKLPYTPADLVPARADFQLPSSASENRSP